MWRKNWKVGYNGKRRLIGKSLIFSVSVNLPIPGLDAVLTHTASTEWIQSLCSSILTIKLFLLGGI